MFLKHSEQKTIWNVLMLLVKNNRHVTVAKIALELRISYGSVHSNIYNDLEFNKVCARWVSKQLSEEHKLKHKYAPESVA